MVLLRDTELQLGTWQKDAWFVFLVCKPWGFCLARISGYHIGQLCKTCLLDVAS